MIHKFWNVRLAPPGSDPNAYLQLDSEANEEKRNQVRLDEEQMEEKVYRIWSTLSTFEESSAACISDMLLHVSNGAYMESVMVAKKFIWHVDILFRATDKLDSTMVHQGVKRELTFPNHCFRTLTCCQLYRTGEKPNCCVRRLWHFSLSLPKPRKPEFESSA